MTLLNVLSDVRMCEKYKIYYPYSIGPIVYTVMPELRGARGEPFPIFGRSFQPGGGRFCPIFTTGTPKFAYLTTSLPYVMIHCTNCNFFSLVLLN